MENANEQQEMMLQRQKSEKSEILRAFFQFMGYSKT
jgi:hypothetical protein